ncbi:AAA family ATPase [Methanobacterium alcaliphilum]|uniref:AAA family ATPase n=1 Tax=Methanobacterium alcaliphilum TaxID=392018 RepID=UPI002009E9C3|nr:AAA family ATPase [Methanobacterium alcaliphilum]MCK9152225.1 AAA family ATPase [Methanobacterium alcaliphilum]
MPSWDIAAVVGVPGVGKTSICEYVSRKIGCQYINYGDLMLDIARDENLAETNYQMFSLDMELQYHIWKEAANIISEKEHTIVDLHGLDQSPRGYLFSMPIEIISPTLIVLVEANPENIILQRKADSSKNRIKDDFKSLKIHMQMLRVSMAISSVILGSGLYLLKNNNLNDSQKELTNLLENF